MAKSTKSVGKTRAVKKKYSLQGSVILLHGPAKIGKTQLSSSFPGPVQFLASEFGHNFIEEEQKDIIVRLDKWSSFMQSLTTKGGIISARPKTIVVDTVSGLYRLCKRHVCSNHGVDHPFEKGEGGRAIWDMIGDKFALGLERLFIRAHQLKATLILIDHTREEEVETSTEDYKKMVAAMPGQARKFVEPMPDHIWFLGYRMKNAKTKEPGDAMHDFVDNRALWVRGTKAVMAGTRDDKIDCSVIPSLPKHDGYDYIVSKLGERK